MTVTELRQALAGHDPHAVVMVASGAGVLSGVVDAAPGLVVLTVAEVGTTPAPTWKGEHGPEHPNAG